MVVSALLLVLPLAYSARAGDGREGIVPSEASAETLEGPAGEDLSPGGAAGLPEEADPDEPVIPSRLNDPPIARARSIPRADDLLAVARRGPDGRLAVDSNGQERWLTLRPDLQAQLTEVLRSYRTPWGAVVVLEPATGRVLAMAEHSSADPGLRGLTTQALYPAASVFKIVTAAALLEAGVSPSTVECSHGAKRGISGRQLADSARDRSCMTLTDALARSANGIFAKLTAKRLSTEQLKGAAAAFHFNRPFEFPIPTDTSLAAIPEDLLGRAEAGSGFGDVFMSPLHGAALAAVAANHGLWKNPILFEDEVPSAAEPKRAISEEQASQLADMMEETVRAGTARRIFRERGMGVPAAVGKTGSLADKRPFRDYSWFVGYAPKNAPEVAVAAVVVNQARWRIRATWLGREAMRLALGGRKLAAVGR